MTAEERLALVRQACTSDDMPEYLSRLDWLAALITDASDPDARLLENSPDPAATLECLRECRLLLEGLRRAFTDDPPPSPLPDDDSLPLPSSDDEIPF